MHDLEKLDKEIEELKHELSVIIPEEIKAAVELGDLKENSEFSSAVFRQHYTGVRLQQLIERRKLHMSYNLDNIPKDQIGIGSIIKVRHKELNKIVYLRLVTSEVSDATEDDIIEITVNSPIGKSLINKRKNDTASIRTPGGMVTYKILNITTIHDLLGT